MQATGLCGHEILLTMSRREPFTRVHLIGGRKPPMQMERLVAC